MTIEAAELEGNKCHPTYSTPECGYRSFQTPKFNDDSTYEDDTSPNSILNSGSRSNPNISRDSSDERSEDSDSIKDLNNNEDSAELLLQQSQLKGEGGSSTLGSIFLIVNAALGAGLLNMPKAFDQAGGVYTAIIVQAVLLFFIMTALIILAMTSNINKSCTLQEVMFTVAGIWGRRATSAIITVYCFGTCITFLIIIGDQFDRAFASLVGNHYCDTWYLHRDFVMPVSSILLILPMCYSKNIDFLKYVSAFGVFIILYVVALVFVEYAEGEHIPGPIKTKPDTWLDVFMVIPVICFGYQCHVSVIPIYSCMKVRNIKNFSIASSTAIVICVFTYTGAATFGYLTFGNLIYEDIISNYNANKPSVMLALVAISLKTYTTYPILLYCGREGLLTILKDMFSLSDSPAKEKIRRGCIVTPWFFSTVLIAMEIPNIGAVIHMLGSLAAIFIFVFPGICLLQTTIMLDKPMRTLKARVKVVVALLFIILGFFLFGLVLTQGVLAQLNPASEVELLCKPKASGIKFYLSLFNH